MRYSEELQRVITWMLMLEQVDRPCSEDLANLPQVQLRIREKRLQDNYKLLKIKEEELSSREIKVTEREETVGKREKELEDKEIELAQA